MKKNQLLYTISMMILITLIGLILNFLILLPAYSTHKFFTADDVKSVAVYHNNKPYFLNILEQKEVLETLNQGAIADPSVIENIVPESSLDADINKLVIKRFDHPEINLIPIGNLDGKMAFHVIGLDGIQYVIEEKPEELKKLLESAYEQ